MSVAVLALRPLANAVREDRFQTIEIRSVYVDAPVRDESGQVLARSLPHDACFPMMDVKTFFEENGGGVSGEVAGMPRE
jgi:hypothetical protein